ncbi:(R)-6-hydroxynicotine oxidase-like [Montipora capricornis]|uniref:(R)-6-hydroxynicotine oxidase-like n=1 Tax=Montipora capricornis TaxID=246305 RepID=UPI0035F18CC1
MNDPKENDDHVMEDLCKESPELSFAVEGQDEYEKSMRRLFNENQSNKPRAFVRPKTVDEVCRVLQFATANQLKVSVLGGGHDPKGLAIIRNGLVLDMLAMKCINIDRHTETAWVEAGVTVKDLGDVTCPQGLAAVNGSCTTVGVVGLTLGGGFGFLSRTQGLAVDNCLQMEMVTVTGQRIVASLHEHEQLFWALRGAGQVGFGVVTKAQVKLHKLQEKYVAGKSSFPTDSCDQ